MRREKKIISNEKWMRILCTSAQQQRQRLQRAVQTEPNGCALSILRILKWQRQERDTWMRYTVAFPCLSANERAVRSSEKMVRKIANECAQPHIHYYNWTHKLNCKYCFKGRHRVTMANYSHPLSHTHTQTHIRTHSMYIYFSRFRFIFLTVSGCACAYFILFDFQSAVGQSAAADALPDNATTGYVSVVGVCESEERRTSGRSNLEKIPVHVESTSSVRFIERWPTRRWVYTLHLHLRPRPAIRSIFGTNAKRTTQQKQTNKNKLCIFREVNFLFSLSCSAFFFLLPFHFHVHSDLGWCRLNNVQRCWKFQSNMLWRWRHRWLGARSNG